MDVLPAVPGETAELLPPAQAATPQQLRLSLQHVASPAAPANTPASPALLQSTARRAAEERRSLPVPASAVARAIEQAAAEGAVAEEGAAADAATIRRLSTAAVEDPTSDEGMASQEDPPVRRTSFFSVPQQAQAAEPQAASEYSLHPAAGAAADPAPAAVDASPAASPAPAPAVVLLHPAAAASPAPATPYAATEYDGEDVVMMDVGEWGVDDGCG